MKRELNKLISIVLLASLIFSVVPSTALYASEVLIPVEEISNEDTLEIVEDAAAGKERSALGADDITSYGKVSTDEEQILESVGRTYNADGDSIAVEVNQGFSYHIVTTAEGGIINATEENTKDVPMNDFTSDKPTAVMVRLPGVYDESEAKAKLDGYTIAITYANSRNIIFEADCSEFSYQIYNDHEDDAKGCMAILRLEDGFAQNSYNIYLRNSANRTVAGRSKVNFYKVKKLRILLVPCIAYYSESGYDQNDPVSQKCPPDQLNKPVECDPKLLEGLDTKIYNYLMDVYPHSDIEIQWAKTADFGYKKYDLADNDDSKDDSGTWMVWNDLCKYQPKAGSGVEQYDRILGFVQYRQGPTSGLMGYTYCAPANIITLSDDDMLATVAHEMAHNYEIGDDYDGETMSSLNPNINPAPRGYRGRHKVTRELVESKAPYVVATSPEQLDEGEGVNKPEDFKDKVEWASGVVVFPNLHTYSLTKNKFVKFRYFEDDEGNIRIQPIISFMGTGYNSSEYYWTTPFIWEHLLKESLVKGPARYSRETENIYAAIENAELIKNADETILTVDDVIDPTYREGNSELIEIKGKIKYTSASGNAVPIADNSVELDVPYSYDGDLSEIDEDEMYLDNKSSDYDLYVFAALDKDGNIIKSPVDGVESKHTFYAGNYNAAACSRSEMSKYFTFGSFNFVAEYPEGTDKFVIYPAARPTEIIKEIKVPDTSPSGDIVYSDINENKAKVDWVVNEYDLDDNVVDEKADDLNVKIFYAPEGDNGVLYPITEGKNNDFPGKDNYGLVTDANWKTVEFDITKYGWTSDAYVLVAVSNGVDAEYMYSDENEITLGNVNTTIDVSKGKRGADQLKHFTYTGEEIEPSVVVKVFDAEAGKYVKLKQDVDYKLDYDSNVNAGEAKVTATGIGNYAGTVSGRFIIDSAPIKRAKLSAMADLIYDGTIDDSIWGNDKCNSLIDVENNMIVRLSGKELYLDSDYTVTYNDKEELPVPSDEAIPVTVKIKGVENYTGEVTVRNAFKLYPASLVKGIISANSIINWDSNKTYSYTGKEIKPKVRSVYVNGEKLNSKYYKVTYSNNIKTGVGNINIAGKNGYVGCINTTFNIERMKVSNLTIKGVSNVVYTGNVVGSDVYLPIRVYAGKIRLNEKKDYTISYNGILDKPSSGLNKANKPSVTITLKDDSKIVEWKKAEWKGGAKTIVKKFDIKKTPFSSRSLVTVNLDSVSENGLKHFFSRNTNSKLLKKYFYILSSCDTDNDGQSDGIKGTITNENINMKLYIKGKELDRSKYTVEISIPKYLNKIGKLTIKPNDTTYYSGKRTVLFLLE